MPGHNPMTAPERSVIFTADDIGIADALNGAMLLSHRQGLLSSRALSFGRAGRIYHAPIKGKMVDSTVRFCDHHGGSIFKICKKDMF
jgi:hypothetical protein